MMYLKKWIKKRFYDIKICRKLSDLCFSSMDESQSTIRHLQRRMDKYAYMQAHVVHLWTYQNMSYMQVYGSRCGTCQHMCYVPTIFQHMWYMSSTCQHTWYMPVQMITYGPCQNMWYMPAYVVHASTCGTFQHMWYMPSTCKHTQYMPVQVITCDTCQNIMVHASTCDTCQHVMWYMKVHVLCQHTSTCECIEHHITLGPATIPLPAYRGELKYRTPYNIRSLNYSSPSLQGRAQV